MTTRCIYKHLLLLVALCWLTGNVTSDFSEEAPTISPSFTTQGTGSVSPTGILLTPGETYSGGVVYRNASQNVLDGFVTTMVISISECDAFYNGTFGFAFFLAPTINLLEGISIGSTFSLSVKTNIAYIGFSMLTQDIRYNATGAGISVAAAGTPNTIPAPWLSEWRCNSGSPITLTIDYTPPSTFQISGSRPTTGAPAGANVTLSLDITQYFPPNTDLYVGMSGSTGVGYMRQELSFWEFSSKPNIVPYLDCYEDLGGGQYKAHMGYDNAGSVTFVEVGPQNFFTPAPSYRGQTELFALTRSRFYPANPFSVIWDGTELTWNLTSHFVTFDANIPSLICPVNITVTLQFKAPRNLTLSELTSVVQSLAASMEISPSRIIVVGFGISQITKRSTTQTDSLAELEIEIAAPGSNTPDEPTAADAVRDFIDKAANRTIGTQVIDPDGSLGLEFLDSFPKETNNNGTGRLITQAPVGQPVPTPAYTPTGPSTPQKVPVFASLASSVLADQIVNCLSVFVVLLSALTI